MPYLFALIGALVVVNIFMLVKRSRKTRDVGKDATAQRIATVKRHDALVRKLDREQEDAARRVELRNKTFEMYDQVRKQSDTIDQSEAERVQDDLTDDGLTDNENQSD